MKSRGMQQLECIFLDYEEDIFQLEQKVKQLQEERNNWMELAMQATATREAMMLEMIVNGTIQKPKTEPDGQDH